MKTTVILDPRQREALDLIRQAHWRYPITALVRRAVDLWIEQAALELHSDGTINHADYETLVTIARQKKALPLKARPGHAQLASKPASKPTGAAVLTFDPTRPRRPRPKSALDPGPYPLGS